jgi:hypothetical protein
MRHVTTADDVGASAAEQASPRRDAAVAARASGA